MLDDVRRLGVSHLSRRGAAALVVLVLAACGGSGGGPGAPNPPAGPPATTPAGFTVTITATGVSPKELRVPIGARVAFLNQDSRPHQMMSAPHPLHTDCPAINAVGTINSGETRTTDVFTVQRACGFHDNMRDGDTTLQGQILVAEAERDPNYGY